ncbi:MAG: hypothetical protein IPL96_16980 [Holophagaceae bacterium]|nr:hypothetical protein [Holophagaceae bacterium]
MVVTAGVTTRVVVPVTAPRPWLRARLVAPVVVQARVLDWPGLRVAGVAVKAVMAGSWVTETVTAAVVEPAALVAVRV